MLLGCAIPLQAQPTPSQRAEVPIREVVLSDGTRRYGVPIRVGQTEIEAGLDTGSTGLRILPNVLKDGDAQPTSRRDTYHYGAGAKLDGVVATASVSVGSLRGDTTVQLVQRVGCVEDQPRCAAGSVPLSQYGVQGNGLPGEGFKAILGVNMAGADVASLFRGIGARRWIVDLPRPGEAGSGRIVLNPSDAEVQGFTSLPVIDSFSDAHGVLHDSVRGCLVNDNSHQKICGAVIFDTGDPGLRIASANPPTLRPWPDETPATLLLADAAGKVRVAEALVIGRRDHASHLTFVERPGAPTTFVFTGLTAYFAYSVLYDPEQRVVGFRPRPLLAGAPQPVPVN
jgi:hypothetical protein